MFDNITIDKTLDLIKNAIPKNGTGIIDIYISGEGGETYKFKDGKLIVASFDPNQEKDLSLDPDFT